VEELVMRRGLSSLLLTLGVFAAALAWSGLTLQRTVFDTGRSERIVVALTENEAVKAALVNASVRAIDGSLPLELRRSVPTEDLSLAARQALDSPEVAAALQVALVDTHRYLLGELETPPTLTQAPIDQALRTQLATVRPDLAGVAAQLPPLEVALPSEGLPSVKNVGDTVRTTTNLAALAAAGLVVTGLVLSPRRGKALRRVGWWAVGVGCTWVGIRYGLPLAAERLFTTDAALVRALADILAGGMAGPGVVMVGAGATLAGVGFASARVQRAQAERKLRQRRQLAASLEDTGSMAQMAMRPAPNSLLQPPPSATVNHRPELPPLSGEQQRDPAAVLDRALAGQEPKLLARTQGSSPSPERPEIKRRRVESDPENDPGSWLGGFTVRHASHQALSAPPPPPPPGPRWVEGYGYVFDQPPYEGAMWVAGIGYVVPPDELERVHPRR
jgi:hypothetical protein